MVAKVIDAKNNEYTDFMARRMVETAGHIIMSYLLVIDASRDEQFRKSAEVYVNFAEGEIHKHAAFVENFHIESIDTYKA
jgi:hypothetical protein